MKNFFYLSLGLFMLVSCEKPENAAQSSERVYPITYTFSGAESISAIRMYNSTGSINGASNHPSAQEESIKNFNPYFTTDIAPSYQELSFKFISSNKVVAIDPTAANDTGSYVRIGNEIIVEDLIKFIEKDGKLILNQLIYSIVSKQDNVTSVQSGVLPIYESFDADMKEIMIDKPDTAAARTFDLVFKKK